MKFKKYMDELDARSLLNAVQCVNSEDFFGHGPGLVQFLGWDAVRKGGRWEMKLRFRVGEFSPGLYRPASFGFLKLGYRDRLRYFVDSVLGWVPSRWNLFRLRRQVRRDQKNARPDPVKQDVLPEAYQQPVRRIILQDDL